MSNLVEHARRELELLGEDPETVEGLIKVVQAYADMGHSGGSHSVVLPMLTRLLNFENLKPLTNDISEWEHIDVGRAGRPDLWQSKRNSKMFSNDAGKTYYDSYDENKELHLSEQVKKDN